MPHSSPTPSRPGVAPGGPGPLAVLGALLLGAALPLGVLVSAAGEPLVRCFGAVLFAVGGGVVLLDVVLRRDVPLSQAVLLLPVVLVIPLPFATLAGKTLHLEALAILIGALGLRHLVRDRGLGRSVLGAVVGCGVLASLLALAQALYQRAEAREAAADVLTDTETGRAFLESTRAAATFVNPNLFAGFLLLVLPATFAWRGRGRLVLLTVLAAGFVAAGSLGATLCLLLAVGLVLGHLRNGARLHAIGRAALALGLFGAILILFAMTFGVAIPGLEGKLTSFDYRLDYHRQAARMFAENPWLPRGLERFGERAPLFVRAGEASSRYVHDGYVQLGIELGVPVLLALGALMVLSLRRLASAPRLHDVGGAEPHVFMSRVFLGGMTAGFIVLPLLSPMVTLFPLTSALADVPLLNGLVAAAIALGVVRFAGNALPAHALPLALTAFALHSLVDFDLHSPNVLAGLGVVATLLRTTVTTRGKPPKAATALTLLLALGGLALPLVIGSHGVLAQRVRTESLAVDVALREGREDHAVPADLPHDVPELTAQRLRLALATGSHERAEEILTRTPPEIRELPEIRRLEAALLARRFRAEPAARMDLYRRLGSLLRDGERIEAELLFRRHRMERVLDTGDPLATAKRALDRAAAFGLRPADHPFLDALDRYVATH